MLVKSLFAVSCMIVLSTVFLTSQRQDEGSAARNDNEWTLEKRGEYARRNDDHSKWDMEMLKADLDTASKRTWPTQPAISDYPSPVADYDWGYCSLTRLEVAIGVRRLKGIAVGYASDKYRPIEDNGCYYNSYFNILFLTDQEAPEFDASQVVSRNYPHYLSTGKQKTTMGEIDWVQMHRADGDNFAIVNQRYFDLHFGRTLIVIPHKDGTIRILQTEHCLPSIRKRQTSEETKMQLEELYQEIRNNKKVVDALSDANVIDQPPMK